MNQEAQSYFQSRVKAIRVSIATAIHTLQNPYCVNGSREVSLAQTDLQRAFHNLGLSLGKIGSPSPYKESYNPESQIIEQTDDFDFKLLESVLEMKTQVASVKEIRRHLKETRQNIVTTLNDQVPGGQFENIDPDGFRKKLQDALNWIDEATCWLGWELRNIEIFWNNRNLEVGDSSAPARKPLKLEEESGPIDGIAS